MFVENDHECPKQKRQSILARNMHGCKWLSQKTINNNNDFRKMSKKKYGDTL